MNTDKNRPLRADFWSSTECAMFMRGLTEALEPRGWHSMARHLATESQYRSAKTKGERLRLRWRCYFSYPALLLRELRGRQRPDVAVVCTNTFYAPFLAARMTRSVPVVHWVFDLFPDVLYLSGALSKGSLAGRSLEWIARSTFEAAAANVFLGQHLLEHATRRFGKIPRSVVIPVGCDARPFMSPLREKPTAEKRTRILYCGNLGRMHETNTILAALRSGLPEGVELTFRGNGAGFKRLEDEATQNAGAVIFGPGMDDATWVAAMKAADIALVTMIDGAENVVMPSKTYSALAAGQAILAICPTNSDLAAMIFEERCGWVVEPGDGKRLSELLRVIAGNRDEVEMRRGNARKAGCGKFDQRTLSGAWDLVLRDAIEFSSVRTGRSGRRPATIGVGSKTEAV